MVDSAQGSQAGGARQGTNGEGPPSSSQGSGREGADKVRGAGSGLDSGSASKKSSPRRDHASRGGGQLGRMGECLSVLGGTQPSRSVAKV